MQVNKKGNSKYKQNPEQISAKKSSVKTYANLHSSGINTQSRSNSKNRRKGTDSANKVNQKYEQTPGPANYDATNYQL